VHKDGHLALLCSRPNCHEKKYAECPERAESKSCSSNTSWVGGLQKTVDDEEFYSLTIYRYFCGKIPDTPPEWYMKKNWPYWPEQENLGS
ncbi:hypothetical protein TELCIR_13935, partial [Teladorsagia circumcincta]